MTSMENRASPSLEGNLPVNELAQASPRDVEMQFSASQADATTPDGDIDIEETPESIFSDDDVQTLLEPSISIAASRLKAPQTPAVEKTAAIEEDGGYFDFDSDPESPPVDDVSGPLPPQVAQNGGGESIEDNGHGNGMSLGPLPSPRIAATDIPITPWHVGPKTFEVQKKDQGSHGALHGVFSGQRSRSLSGGAEALKRLIPRGLPSMAQVKSLFDNSTEQPKLKSGSSSNLTVQGGSHRFRSCSQGSGSSSPLQGLNLPQSGAHGTVAAATSSPPIHSRPPDVVHRPQIIRSVTSHESLLYHSMSRASSLGDDARFENQREQVNSRGKAIRDSLQDRSSFRMPQMPTMPSMPRVPYFNFNMNFLNSGSGHEILKSEHDSTPEIRHGRGVKHKTVGVAAVVANGVGAAVAEPGAARKTQVMSEGSTTNYLEQALQDLTGDIVIMGGYRGSVLRSAKTHQQHWVPVKVGLNIRKVDLEVGLEPEDEERMSETIYASGMLRNIGPVDISKRLFKRLAESENARNGTLRIWDYGYDWRLSPHLLSRQLEEFLQKLPSNQAAASISDNGGALIVAHSLGGLITRHVVNRRPELFSGVVYAGVPQTCVNILGPLRNGDAVLLSSRVLTAQVNFTLRTSYVLLPEDGRCFVDLTSKEAYPVDFFDINDWIKYRFTPCTDPPLPPRNPQPSGLGGKFNLSAGRLSVTPGRKSSAGSPARDESPDTKEPGERPQSSNMLSQAADAIDTAEGGRDRTLAPQMNNSNPVNKGQSTNSSVSTAVTIPRDKAIAYLTRTLAETKAFKRELHHNPFLSQRNRYPPLALIYGKSIPTIHSVKVDGREGIACSDAYDNLVFASGDGVCLARQAMLPDGYQAVNGGRIASDRGHVTLLGDLNAVGRAIIAVRKGRERGIGLGE